MTLFESISGPLQEAAPLEPSFFASIPPVVQFMAGMCAILGVAWFFLVEPRIDAKVNATRDQLSKERKEEIGELRTEMKEIKDEIGELRTEMKNEIGELRTETKEEIDGLRTEMKEEIGELRAEMKDEIGELRTEMKNEIDELRTETKKEIDGSRTELKGEIGELRTEIKNEIGELRTEMKDEIDGSRTEMKDEIGELRTETKENDATLREELKEEIRAGRASIGALQEAVAASRIEYRDMLSAMREENHQAHEAIGDRIGQMQAQMVVENRSIREDIAEVKVDTARLAGAVDVLTAIMRDRRKS